MWLLLLLKFHFLSAVSYFPQYYSLPPKPKGVKTQWRNACKACKNGVTSVQEEHRGTKCMWEMWNVREAEQSRKCTLVWNINWPRIRENKSSRHFAWSLCFSRKNVCWTIFLCRQLKAAQLYLSVSGRLSEAMCFKRGDGESLINYIMQKLSPLPQISCLSPSPSPSICASLRGDWVHNKIFIKPWTGGAISPHKLVCSQHTQTHTYKLTIYTEHSLSTHMVTSSTEEKHFFF